MIRDDHLLAFGLRVMKAANQYSRDELAAMGAIDPSMMSSMMSGKKVRPEVVYRVIEEAGGVRALEEIANRFNRFADWYQAEHLSRSLLSVK